MVLKRKGPQKPTLVVGDYNAFCDYRKDHPDEWLIHVTRREHFLGFEAKAVVTVGEFDWRLLQEAKARVR